MLRARNVLASSTAACLRPTAQARCRQPPAGTNNSCTASGRRGRTGAGGCVHRILQLLLQLAQVALLRRAQGGRLHSWPELHTPTGMQEHTTLLQIDAGLFKACWPHASMVRASIALQPSLAPPPTSSCMAQDQPMAAMISAALDASNRLRSSGGSLCSFFCSSVSRLCRAAAGQGAGARRLAWASSAASVRSTMMMGAFYWAHVSQHVYPGPCTSPPRLPYSCRLLRHAPCTLTRRAAHPPGTALACWSACCAAARLPPPPR